MSNSLVRLADEGLRVEQIGGRASLETGKIAVQVYARGEQVYDLDHDGNAFQKLSDEDTVTAIRTGLGRLDSFYRSRVRRDTRT